MAGAVDKLAPPPIGTSGGKFLGVPEGYIAQRPPASPGPDPEAGRWKRGEAGPPQPQFYGQAVAPRFTESNVVSIAALPTETIARLQSALYRAGVFTSEDEFTFGRWDDTSKTAYRKLLSYANESGLDEQAALAQWAQLQAADPTQKGRRRAPLSVTLTNPLDVAAVANDVARKRVGRKLSDDELARFTAAYQGAEAATQRQAYNAAEMGGTMTEAPSAASMALDEAEKIDPTGAQEMDLLGLNDTIMGYLRGSD